MKARSNKALRNLFVLDTDAPWNRSLLQAMPPDMKIHGFRIRNAFAFPGGLRGQFQKVGRTEWVSDSWDDTWISIPGWNKGFGLSSWLVTRQVNRAARRFGKPDAILFTLPWHAKVAQNFSVGTKAYYAHDTFRFYDWDSGKIMRLERRLLDSCHIGFGVARRVVKDLEEMSSTPVHYLPMATAWVPGQIKFEGEAAADKDLEPVPKPRVGCIGQIDSRAYDWDLIECAIRSFPHVQFVFIGPILKERSRSAADRFAPVFARPNVRWLGPKPHAHLPAYLRRFDVCFNPLGVSEHGHRRSPLRLFDYLTTNRPIVSTAVAEAFNHLPFISIAKDKEEFRWLLGEALALKAAPDLECRRNYITANTWHARAKEFCGLMERTASTSPADERVLFSTS